MNLRGGMAFLVTLSGASLLLAQVFVPGAGYRAVRPYGAAYAGYGYGVGAGYASTPYQSYAYGMSAMMRSQAAANQMNAEAAVVGEQAKQAALETQKKSTETYFELRRMNDEYRAAEAARKAELRKQNNPSGVAQVSVKRLSAYQLDPVTGKIHWPPVLMTPEMRTYRDKLDALFSEHATTGRPLTLTEVQTETHGMRRLLDAQFDSLAPLDWINGKNLLEGLEREIYATPQG